MIESGAQVTVDAALCKAHEKGPAPRTGGRALVEKAVR